MTSYEEIFNIALQLIDDPILAKLSETDLSSELSSWLVQSVYMLPKLSNELSDRDDELQTFNGDLSDSTKMALAMEMKRMWLKPQIASITLTLQRSSKKEAYSQAEHLKTLQTLDDTIDIEIKKLLRDQSYSDSSYFD